MYDRDRFPFALLMNELLRDFVHKAEVIFVHAWVDLHERSLAHVVNLKKQSGARYIVLNGAEEYEKEGPGFSYWKKQLIALGVSDSEIIATLPAKNTGEEAHFFLKFLVEHNLTRAYVYTVPQHILRAFLTDLGHMDALGYKGFLYPSTLHGVNFEEAITIRPLANGQEETTRIGRFAEEILRIINYRQLYDEGNPDFIIASVKRGLDYLKHL